MVGLSSYLLISYWFTRIETSLGGILAILINRIGDIFYLLGILISLLLYNSIDILTLISNTYINNDILLFFFFLAAMAKSAQIFLHIWLPYSMEGRKINLNKGNKKRNYSKYIRDKKGTFIKGSHSINKNRDNCITSYQKEAIIGLLLSDGYIEGKILKFTFKTGHLEFIKWLKFNILGSICSLKEPYPKINPTQYTFSTLSFNYFKKLRLKWYIESYKGYIKIIPFDLYKYFTAVSLAFLIMGDGYWCNNSKTIYICTESFTLKEIHILLFILRYKFKLVASITKKNNRFRIRFSSRYNNLKLLRSLVINHFHPIMKYKLGI